jgi:hypothetical protein
MQAMPLQKLVEVARSNPETVFVNQVFKKAPKGSLSCVKDGKADRAGLDSLCAALSSCTSRGAGRKPGASSYTRKHLSQSHPTRRNPVLLESYKTM